MLHLDGERYELQSFVVMPNHVHLVVRPFPGHELEDICQTWKRHSARQINLALGREGKLWQRECYDRIIRDGEHLWRITKYIGRNPAEANVTGITWLSPIWQEHGWEFS